MAGRRAVELTAHFERSLESIEAFLAEAGASQAFDALPIESSGTVTLNLERLPGIGRHFLEHPIRSVEVATDAALASLEPIERIRAVGSIPLSDSRPRADA